MYSHKVIDRYVLSIFDLAKEKKILDIIKDDMMKISEIGKSNRDFLLLIRSPVISNAKKSKILTQLFTQKLNPLTVSFLELLAKKGRVAELINITYAFVRRYKAAQNIKEVTLVVSEPLNDKIKKKITKFLKGKINHEIDLIEKIDESIIGGFILYYDDVMLDQSMAGQLKSLKRNFLEAK